MTAEDIKLLEELSGHVNRFKNWLSEHYSKEAIANGVFDDAGYPHRDHIENTFEAIFKSVDFESLKSSALDNMVYLIARQWDVGVILNWFNKGSKEIGGIGMTKEQLYLLSKYGLKSSESDARAQFAFSLYKVENYRPDIVNLLLRYHENEYVRRGALNSLSKLSFNNTKLCKLLEKSWSFDQEFERMMCLKIFKSIDKKNFNYYCDKAINDKREILRGYAKRLKNNKESGI